jgi:ABC-type transport system substrate-binding protein
VISGQRWRGLLAVVALFALLVSACGRSASTSNTGNTARLANTTPPGKHAVDKVVWGVYRETNSLDPIFAFDYPENTVLALLCEQLIVQSADGSIGPGLATLTYPNATTLVFDLKPGITFWDGKPLTPDDVVYSLQRNTDASLGGFYAAVFANVKSIAATGPSQVTITLTRPDYWLPDELASTPGWIVEKAYVEAKGKDFGTPTGGTMCTGAYKLQSWRPGDVLSVVRNDSYWNPNVKPLVREIDFKGTPDEASLTSALETGVVVRVELDVAADRPANHRDQVVDLRRRCHPDGVGKTDPIDTGAIDRPIDAEQVVGVGAKGVLGAEPRLAPGSPDLRDHIAADLDDLADAQTVRGGPQARGRRDQHVDAVDTCVDRKPGVIEVAAHVGEQPESPLGPGDPA